MKLIDNGLHSFRKAILNLKILDEQNEFERELVAKDIILSLHHSIETLFKYMIQKENELLIYDNLNDYFKMKMNSIKNKGKREFNGNTITFMEAIKRAVVLNNLQMNQTQYGSFEHLNDIRNAITHHEYDLTGKQINYLITQVITVVFPIYRKFIPNFTKYVREHELNLIGSVQVKELHVWKFIRFFTLYNKFVEGKEKINSTLKVQGEFSKKQKRIKKEPFITYHDCPCCKKPFFVKDNLVLYNMEEKAYTGTCHLCEISFDREDSYFIYLTSEDYNSFCDGFINGYSIVSELLDDEDLKDKITEKELLDIKTIYSQKEGRKLLLEYTNNNVSDKLENILERYGQDIVLYKYDTEIMDNALHTGKITDEHEIEELTSEDHVIFQGIKDTLKVLGLQDESYREALEREYIYYYYRSHPDPHQDNEEVEIEIELTLILSGLIYCS